MNKAIFMVTLSMLVAVTDVYSRGHRVAQIPNGSELGCAACHVNPNGGGSRNDFGDMVEDDFLSGGNVVWGPALASADADGDGFSNGHELEDPFGIWVNGNAGPGTAAFVTNPGSNSAVPTGDAAKPSLRMQFTDMTPHVGQYFELRVVDAANDQIVASEDLSGIVDAAFDLVVLHALENAGSYNVDFWADHSGNGSYDAPPTDHAWRVAVSSVSGNTTESFSHNTDFTDIGTPVSLDPVAAAPVDFRLYDNYPNPFNPETVIRYELAVHEFVEVNIYDLRGALIRTLYSGLSQPGVQSLSWNAVDNRGEQVPAGIYLYALQTDSQLLSKRMILLK